MIAKWFITGTSILLSSVSFCTDSLLGDLLKPLLGQLFFLLFFLKINFTINVILKFLCKSIFITALTTSTSDEVRVESLKALKGLGVHTTEKGLTTLFNGLLAQITG